MNRHTAIGAELLAQSNSRALNMAADIARHHHEWWNGQGYPDRLSGLRISLCSRITAIADVFDSLTHSRSFSAAWTIDSALEKIRTLRGSQFDPDLTDRFLEMMNDLQRLHCDLGSYLANSNFDTPFCHARKRIRALLDHCPT
jgi:putative two-component system response regulator